MVAYDPFISRYRRELLRQWVMLLYSVWILVKKIKKKEPFIVLNFSWIRWSSAYARRLEHVFCFECLYWRLWEVVIFWTVASRVVFFIDCLQPIKYICLLENEILSLLGIYVSFLSNTTTLSHSLRDRKCIERSDVHNYTHMLERHRGCLLMTHNENCVSFNCYFII